MDRPGSKAQATTDPERVRLLTGRFLHALGSSTSADINAFLPPPDDPMRPAILVEIIKADLHQRWSLKQGRLLEDYVRRFPELGGAGNLPVELVLEEYQARVQAGAQPDPASYEGRFPAQYPQFLELLRDSPAHTTPPSVGTHSEFAATPSAPPFVAPVPPRRAPAPPSLPIPAPVHGYKFLKRLGSGSFAEVWQGEAPGGVAVAIKRIIRPIEDEQAQRELQSLEQMKQLRNIFLLQNHAYFLVEGYLYVVMELADGSLRDRLRDCQKAGLPGVPPDELLRYFREAAEALDYMHSQNVLHRDVKPHNILLLNGHAKVADFGLALLLESQRIMLSASGSGTPAYMAPEVWLRKVGPRSDQYSLAFSYAELRMGKSPFASRDLHGLRLDHLESEPQLESLPEAEQKVLHKALAKDPAQRYDSCREFMRAMDGSLRTSGVVGRGSQSLPSIQIGPGQGLHPGSSADPTAPDPASVRTQLMPRPHRLLRRLTWAALVLLLLGGAAAWYLLQPPFVLREPPAVMLRAGEARLVSLDVQRQRFAGPIQLAFEGVPANCDISEETIPADSKSVFVTISAAPDAVVGKDQQVTVRASGGGHHEETSLRLTVDCCSYELPPGWVKGQGAKLEEVDGKLYYSRIDVVKDGDHVPFLLIPHRKKTDPATFYIMEDKVWAGLFRKYAEQPGVKLQSRAWEKLESNQEPDNPVLDVVAPDALGCAEWLGGRLPHHKQWDKAAGRFEDNPGIGPYELPFKPGVDIAIGRDAPLKRGMAAKDRSPFGCRDMAGNGREWTGFLIASSGPRESLDSRITSAVPLTNEDMLTVRGKNYTSPTPFAFKDIKEGKPGGARALSVGPPNGGLGFRVVLEP